MRYTEPREPFRWGRLAIFFCVVFAVSIALAIYWSSEADLPMTAERYTALCNDQPECYPGLGSLLLAIAMSGIALVAGFLAGLCLAVKWLRDKLASR